jgi:hypothetical protein
MPCRRAMHPVPRYGFTVETRSPAGAGFVEEGRSGGLGTGHVHVAALIDGILAAVVLLGPALNAALGWW